MTTPDPTPDQLWTVTEFQRLRTAQFEQGLPCRIAVVVSKLTVDDVIAMIRGGAGDPGEIYVIYASTPLPLPSPLVGTYLFWNCANRSDLNPLLIEAAHGERGIILVEEEDNLQVAEGASNAELNHVAKTWVRFQLHGRLIFAPTISALHGGVLSATRIATSLFEHLAR